MIYVPKNTPAAQGDMLIRRIEKLPDGLTLDNGDNGKYVLAHSETGHCHVIKKQKDVTFYSNDNDPLVAYLVVDNTKCFVEHERDYDTHESIGFDPGIYEIRRQIESDDSPEGWRRAID